MTAPNVILSLMGCALPFGFILGLLVRRALKVTPGKQHVSGFLIVSAGATLTVVTTALIAIAVTQTFAAITYPKYTATVIEVDSHTGIVEDDDGNEETKTYYQAIYQFTGPDGGQITRRSDQSGTSSPRKGDQFQLAYKDGKALELNGLGYLFLGVFWGVALISFWLWRIFTSPLWRQKKPPAQ